ncbi:MAG: DivIVA domain-containing protein [Ignavibacteriaceae bacterium]|nr:DivIVA domain-containing protein [Ignavibacteriaceae bacterium]
MKISPVSIKRQEFSKKMRGYDPEEVQAFLEKLADDIDELLNENEELNVVVETLNEKLTEFQKIEKNLQDTLLKAQESSTKAIESTKKQSNLMIKEAELKAAQIVEKARESANEIRSAVINLREERDLIVSKLKAIINSQAHLLEVKVEQAGDEKVLTKKQAAPQKLDIDLDDIVDKIL